MTDLLCNTQQQGSSAVLGMYLRVIYPVEQAVTLRRGGFETIVNKGHFEN